MAKQLTHADITAAGYLNPDLYVPRTWYWRRWSKTHCH